MNTKLVYPVKNKYTLLTHIAQNVEKRKTQESFEIHLVRDQQN